VDFTTVALVSSPVIARDEIIYVSCEPVAGPWKVGKRIDEEEQAGEIVLMANDGNHKRGGRKMKMRKC